MIIAVAANCMRTLAAHMYTRFPNASPRNGTIKSCEQSKTQNYIFLQSQAASPLFRPCEYDLPTVAARIYTQYRGAQPLCNELCSATSSRPSNLHDPQSTMGVLHECIVLYCINIHLCIYFVLFYFSFRPVLAELHVRGPRQRTAQNPQSII